MVAGGGEPKGVIRDPEQNRCVRLPIIGREHFVKGSSRVEQETSRQRTPGLPSRAGFPFLAGQPAEVRAAYEQAMGLARPPARART